MESKDKFLPENFLMIMDKNKINHPAPLPNFSQLKKMTINFSSQLRKMNLPSFKDFYSCQGLVYNDNNEYLTNTELIEKVSLLTVFGIKYKYLNRKKCFPTKLTNEQLKLKKAFVCLEIIKFDNTKTSEKVWLNYDQQYGALEKINQHFEDTWKESEYSFEDEYLTFAVLNLGRLYSEFDEKSKIEEFSKKIAKALRSYIEKPGKTNKGSDDNLITLANYINNSTKFIDPFSQHWASKVAFRINLEISK